VRWAALGIDPATIAVLVSGGSKLAAVFDNAVAAGADPKTVANWVTGEVTAYLRRESVDFGTIPLTGEYLFELERLYAAGDLSSTAAKQVLVGVMAGEGSPAEVAAERDLVQISDTRALGTEIDRVLAEHPEAYQRLKEGDPRVVGFLVGQVMKVTAGKADPRVVSALLGERAEG
jgi:aspartyl-tRNA(Asn)/glutamyl-tRNA(Gln) amidotransferase subunit B